MVPVRGRAAEAALVGIYTLLLLGAVITVLWVGRGICIPIALAILFAFLLAPVVRRLERWIGRIAAVLLVVGALTTAVGAVGYVVAHQVLDLTNKLPQYQANIQAKLRAIHPDEDGVINRLTRSVDALRHDMPGLRAEPVAIASPDAPSTPQVIAVESNHDVDQLGAMIGPVFGFLAATGLVALLTIFVLLRREDLRGRLIRLLGQGNIAVSTTAMVDAADRVSKYLCMQLIVNVSYGIPIGIGLWFIGVPNAALWGALTVVLRFIPYIGSWISAGMPILLSLAVSDGWLMPALTVALFVVLELISNNVMEPWLYGASTGVSSIALVLATAFWAWLWGPVGLVVATPLTVCLAVAGRYVPRLRFLSVLLSDEAALTESQDCYNRLLRSDVAEASALVDRHLDVNSLTSLYDDVLLPVVASAEQDFAHQAIDAEQRASVQVAIQDIIDDQRRERRPDLETVVPSESGSRPDRSIPTVLCIPVRAERDALAAQMLVHLLAEAGSSATVLATGAVMRELIGQAVELAPETICISVVAPSALVHARRLCAELHARLPRAHIMVGLWGATAEAPGFDSLRAAGAGTVVRSLSEAIPILTVHPVPLAA